MAKPIGTLGVIDTLTIGGRVFTNLASLITLVGGTTDLANPRTVFRKTTSGTATGYAPSGVTFKFAAVHVKVNDVTGDGWLGNICYADNDVGFSSATAFTNPVFMTSGASFTITPFVSSSFDTDNVGESFYYPDFVVPSGKFVSMQSGAIVIGYIWAWGYEV